MSQATYHMREYRFQCEMHLETLQGSEGEHMAELVPSGVKASTVAETRVNSGYV